MHKKWLQKTSTVFLLVLFVFIHAVKIFHTHNYADVYFNKTTDKNAAIVKAGFTCAICDFQIAKDSDAAFSTPVISSPSRLIKASYNYTSVCLHTFSITSSVRGPPSNLS